MKLLLVTNDFPPRIGGIQTYLWSVYSRIAAAGVEVRVLAPAYPGGAAFDRAAPFEIVRWPGAVYWPTHGLDRRVREMARAADVVCFGAVLPMNAIAKRLDPPVVIHTHGFEVALARLPGGRAALRGLARSASLLTTLSSYTDRFIGGAVGNLVSRETLRTGIDLDRFHPDVDGEAFRKRFGLGTRPVVACVSRLVPRKGQDLLIRAMPLIQRRVPDAALLIVGGGPIRGRLEGLARRTGVAESVTFAGEVPEEDLPAAYAAGDIFAMPCRSRWAGLEVEGLGLVFLEAQACGRAAIAGTSGGAPETVVHGETGFVVGGRDRRGLAWACARLLADLDRARAMGEAGRRHVEARYRWEHLIGRFRRSLESLADHTRAR